MCLKTYLSLLRGLSGLALSATLIGCSILTPSGSALTPVAATVVSAPPTVVTLPATPIHTAPSTVPATVEPVAQPVIGFEPQAGGPGTSVRVFGSGYLPEATVVVRLGLPEPLGEVLASVEVDGSGRWTTQLIMPERLPSGEVISGDHMRLVAMNERNQALASAPFTFRPPPAYSDSPGPGWVFALTSDANFDGIEDTVFYRPASIIPETSFDNPRLDAVAVVASDVAVVQRSPSGLDVLLNVDIHGGRADVPLFDFAQRREPSAYLLALDPARGPLLNLLPYGASGAGYGGPIGINWDSSAGGFRIVAELPQ